MTTVILSFFLLAASASAQLTMFTVVNGLEQAAAATLILGSTVSGETLKLKVRIRNTSSSPVPLQVLSVSGMGFSLDSQPSLPFSLGPNLATDFFVLFETDSFGTALRGALRWNTATVALEATATAAARLQVEFGKLHRFWK